MTPIDGDHGTVPDKTPVKTDTNGRVIPYSLPKAAPDSVLYKLDRWIDADTGNTIEYGLKLTKDITIKPVFVGSNPHTLTPVAVDHAAFDTTPIRTDGKGIVQDNLPTVTLDDYYRFERWIYVASGETVSIGDLLLEDVEIKPVISYYDGPFKVYFQTADYYTLSDAAPLTTAADNKVPMNQMPEVFPIVSHFFDGVWVNTDTNEVVNADTRLKSDITVKPQINCLFTEHNGAVTGFSDYAQDKDVESITIPNNIMGKTVTRIGESAFSDYLRVAVPNPKALEGKHVVIQEGIFTLEKSAFGGSNYSKPMNYESFQLPDGLKIIGKSAFGNCGKLTSITIPDTVTRIENIAFMNDANLSSVRLGGSVKFLGHQTFFRCTALRSISLPSSLRTIDKSCFESSSLESITVPDGCSVGDNAFIFCENLKTATLGEGTTSLNGTFQRCSNLKTVRLSSSIKSINANAFYYCPNLAYIYMKGSRNSVSGAPWSSSRTHPTVVWNSK